MIRIKKILKSILVIGVLSAVVIGATNALFSDEETSRGNTFTAGELDLKIDNTSYYNGEAWEGTTWNFADLNDGEGPAVDENDVATGQYLFFNFFDLKPDDEGEDTISLHVQNDAYACMSITKTEDDDETCNTPELVNDPTCNELDDDLFDGELGGLLQFIFWADDGDNVLEDDETVFREGVASTLFDGVIWPLADSSTNIWNSEGGPMLASQDYFIGKAWCFGTLTQAAVAEGQGTSPIDDPGVTCDGTLLDNASQTDKFMADIEFSAVQSRHNEGFLCNEEEFCYTPGAPFFASTVLDTLQGDRKDGSDVAAARSTPTQGLVLEFGNVETNFYSLGFGGWIEVGFSDIFVDGPGNDLKITEDTWGAYPLEKADVFVSKDGTNWTLIGAADNSNSVNATHTTTEFDLGSIGWTWANYVRIVDISDSVIFPPEGDGYDLNAVEALSPGHLGPCESE